MENEYRLRLWVEYYAVRLWDLRMRCCWSASKHYINDADIVSRGRTAPAWRTWSSAHRWWAYLFDIDYRFFIDNRLWINQSAVFDNWLSMRSSCRDSVIVPPTHQHWLYRPARRCGYSIRHCVTSTWRTRWRVAAAAAAALIYSRLIVRWHVAAQLSIDEQLTARQTSRILGLSTISRCDNGVSVNMNISVHQFSY